MSQDLPHSAARRALLKGVSASALLAALPGFARTAGADWAWPPRIAAWEQAKFGMFIHWGPYSLASVEASWPIMTKGRQRITEAEYVELYKRFNPVKFDPEAFVDAAQSAGQRYMVFTTKHHDGFCMFDSAQTGYKISNTPYKKDIVKLLSDACARRGMPLGFYYSPPDLHHPGFRDTSKLAVTNWGGEPKRPQWGAYLDYMEAQLRELLTRYGDVMTIWFDGLGAQEKYDGQRFVDLIAKLQPATLVNNRIGNEGDYATPEQFIPRGIPTRGVHMNGTDASAQEKLTSQVPAFTDFKPWETCMTINGTWAYNANDRAYKSSRELIRALVEVASRGGNFLLNVGPRPDGTIQPEFGERLAAIGRWMKTNGDAIHGTRYGPVQGQAAYRTTEARDAVYVHVFDWPKGKLSLPDFGRKIVVADTLAVGRKIAFEQDDVGTMLDLSGLIPDADATVLRLRTA